jgi:hypothetical protein
VCSMFSSFGLISVVILCHPASFICFTWLNYVSVMFLNSVLIYQFVIYYFCHFFIPGSWYQIVISPWNCHILHFGREILYYIQILCVYVCVLYTHIFNYLSLGMLQGVKKQNWKLWNLSIS